MPTDLLQSLAINPGGPPTLAITDGAGALLPDAPSRVFAWVCFPDDEQRRQQYLVEVNEQAQALDDKQLSRADALEAATRIAFEMRARNPQLRPLPIYSDSAVYRMGVVAGLLLIALSSPPERKLGLTGARRQWMRIAREQAERLRDVNMDHPVPTDEKLLKAACRSHHAVAHLCAAFVLWGAWRDQPEYPLFELLDFKVSEYPLFELLNLKVSSRESFDPRHIETLPAFLGAAEALRIAGQHHYPSIGRGGAVPGTRPLLDPRQTVRLPADLALPLVAVRPISILPAAY